MIGSTSGANKKTRFLPEGRVVGFEGQLDPDRKYVTHLRLIEQRDKYVDFQPGAEIYYTCDPFGYENSLELQEEEKAKKKAQKKKKVIILILCLALVCVVIMMIAVLVLFYVW